MASKTTRIYATVLVLVFLAAVVISNIVATRYGAIVTPYTAFLLVGLGMIIRKVLQNLWTGDQLVKRIGALILIGCALSWLVVRDAGMVALGSAVGFLVSGTIGSIGYAKLKGSEPKRRGWSNIIEAVIDSLLFIAIAFGWPPNFHVVYAQIMAKVAGGVFWALILRLEE